MTNLKELYQTWLDDNHAEDNLAEKSDGSYFEKIKSEDALEVHPTSIHGTVRRIIVTESTNVRIRKKELKILFREINNLEKKFTEISYKYIPREKNTIADLVAKKAIDYHIN